MNTLLIDKKKYVVILKDDYEKLLEKASINTPTARKLSLAQGKKMAYALIDKWHKEK
jgi:hypothetical protein